MQQLNPRKLQHGLNRLLHGTPQQGTEAKQQELDILKKLPGRMVLAAILLLLAVFADLPWLQYGFWKIIGIRLMMTLACLLGAWLCSKCRTSSQAEWIIIGEVLLASVSFGLLGDIENCYYDYTLAIFQIIVFVLLFFPIRSSRYAILLGTTGLLWFVMMPRMLGQLTGTPQWYGHTFSYAIFSIMLVLGNVFFLRLRRIEQESRINLVQRAQQLEARTEQMLQESDRRYERLLQMSSDPTFLHNGSTILDANDAFIKLAGASSAEEVRGISVHTLIVPEQWELISAQYEAVLNHEGLQLQEHGFKRAHGETIEVESYSMAVMIHGEKSFIQTVMRDLTARKRMEEKLGRSDKLSSLGQLAAGVAHEIRNPLTSLKGFVQLLRTKSPEHNRYYDIMSTELDRINMIVGEFMLMAKPQKAEFRNHHMSSILDDVLSLVESQAYLNHVLLRYSIEPDLPPVYCDGNQLKQVLINLIRNAVEAMPDGGNITIGLEGRDGHVIITIEDEGIGIPEEKLPRLGEPFYTTKETGTGLGLNVCYRIIAAHNGRMSIRSKLHEGTTVEIELPVT
jgi:two-component system, sporulation sensor kinase A